MDFATAANAVNLAENFNQNSPANGDSVSTFIDNLFQNGNGQVRNPATMTQGMIAAAQANNDGYWLITDQAVGLILTNWLSIWMDQINNGNGAHIDPRLTQTDIALFRQIAAYVQRNEIALFVPNLDYYGPVDVGNATPVYTIDGYEKVDLFFTGPELANMQLDTAIGKILGIMAFMELFATGAHIVAISSGQDLPHAGQKFWSLFQKSSYMPWRNAGPLNQFCRTAYMHSHYSGAKGLSNLGSAYAYPNTVTTEAAPSPCPFVCSLLVDDTAHIAANSFLQLEGWPGTKAGNYGISGRHGQDFAVHQATKWNISTYGASPFSEKRGTTVFLAPTTWQPDMRVTTWAAYQGAKTLQSWYDTALIRPTANLL